MVLLGCKGRGWDLRRFYNLNGIQTTSKIPTVTHTGTRMKAVNWTGTSIAVL